MGQGQNATERAAPEEPVVAAGTDPLVARLTAIVRQIGVGNRLPSERDLAIELGVSRTALRDRIQTLVGVGILRRVTGAGTYVQELDSSGLAFTLNVGLLMSHLPLQSLTSVRQALERQAAAEATVDSDPVLVAYLGRELRIIAESDDDAEVDDADFRFHVALLRAARNPALSFFADALSGVLREAQKHGREQMRRIGGDRAAMIDMHQTIYDGVSSGDPESAMRAVDYHFRRFAELTGHPVGEH